MSRRWLSLYILLTLYLCTWAQESYTVFTASDSTDHYVNGAVLTAFHDTLYCMWQSSAKDEDSPGTCVVYSYSTDDGMTWSAPTTLAVPTDTSYCTSGGWMVCGDTLTAYINVWPKALSPKGGYTYYKSSTDGRSWSGQQPVLMADGSVMAGVLEQDPYRLPGGRIVGACHFQPGLHICPIYTDNRSGQSGWHRADFRCEGNEKQSRFIEPSQYVARDSTVVMVFRDQQSTFRKFMAFSRDNGATWTEPTESSLADARTKQCAGNLPDGTAFMVSCPSGMKRRWPLVLLLSSDGYNFDQQIMLQDGNGLPPRRYEGKAKTLGYNYPKALVHKGWLYVVYSVNKEDIICTRVSRTSLP